MSTAVKVIFRPSLTLLQEAIKRRGREMADFAKLNARIAVRVDGWVQRNFRTQGRLVGGWAPFKYGGRVVRGGVDTSAKLLQNTGNLRRSVRTTFDKQKVVVGSPLDYAAYHNFGTRTLPQRRILPTEKDMLEIAMVDVNAYLKRMGRPLL